MNLFNLNRFIEAQDEYNSYENALEEVKKSEKEGHWIWYVFPQMAGLGRSHNSSYYGIKSLLEAKAYFEEDTLRKRLREITTALYNQECTSPEYIFGDIDAMKVCSCMTLFELISPGDIFTTVLDCMYEGNRCESTLAIVRHELEYYTQKSAFKRNGIIKFQDRGFFELGVCESDEIGGEPALATFVDLMRRGETMTKMLSHYLWQKDFSDYRLSGVEFTLNHYLSEFIIDLAKNTKDQTLITSLLELQKKITRNNDNVFSVATNWDTVFTDLIKDERLTDGIKKIASKSLAQ